MARYLAFITITLALAGCATFKELNPDPALSPQERGYIELKNDKENFELTGGKKYFITFPPPTADNFALVLVTNVKPELHAYLTSSFNDGEGQIVPLPDEAASSDSISVYALSRKYPAYYWVMDGVTQDVILSMHYRYVPQWRYSFETRYAQYADVLSKNRIDRSTYQSIGENTNTDGLNAEGELRRLGEASKALQSMRGELEKLEKIFPPNIASTADTAYRNYVDLRDRTDDELTFQKNYSDALTIFQTDRDTRGNVPAFAEATSGLTRAVGKMDRFPAPLASKIRNVLTARLAEVGPYYENLLRSKNTLAKISPEPSMSSIAGLYKALGLTIPPESESLYSFIHRFNVESAGVSSANERLASLKNYFQKNIANPPEPFYRELVSRVGQVKAAIPEPLSGRVPGYGNYVSAVMMGEEIARLTARVNDMQALYQGALEVQGHINARMWPVAENVLRRMYEDQSYRDSRALGDERDLIVRRFEADLVNGVTQASRARVDEFVRDHVTTIDNVPALYQDSVFTPVYQLTFSSFGPNDLAKKRQQIDDYLTHMKYYQFPETAIKAIYQDLMRNLNARGAEKARAIMEHGKNYRGDDKQVKAYIAECTPSIAKRIVKPKEYRKVLALPVTNNSRGSNEYIVRLLLQIPSEAQFPVFDINIKLPADLAEKAGTTQWYDEITINKKPIKNEGRFRITSPLPSNNFETQITPVQMDKEGNNVLEVRFHYPGFRVFEISAMAQVPIIRKN